MCTPFTVPTVRFWRRVVEAGDCWLWTGGQRRANGYGVFAFSHTRQMLAHRFAYEDMVGEIPQGLQLDHLCRNTLCVNPAHLEPVTGRVNTLRGFGPSAANAAKTHCPSGHPYDERNTRVKKDGRRVCKTCAAASDRRRYERKGTA